MTDLTMPDATMPDSTTTGAGARGTAHAHCKQGELAGNDLGGVLEFQGIPYAKDGGRLKRTLPAEAWDGVFDATGTAPAFPQQSRKMSVRGFDGHVEIDQREDAFVVNIWTPAADDDARPVMLWLHGGGYSAGSAAYPSYSGAEFARSQNVVFVSANYRLGALGNLHLPGIADDNLALDDLMAAYSWVRDNISAFGGDPDNITLAGQSAGAWFATLLAGQPEIAESLSKLMLMSVPAPEPLPCDEADRLAGLLLEKLGIADSPQKILEVPVNKILDATRKVASGFGISFMPYEDGERVTSNIFEQAIAHSRNVPLLDGVTAQESTFFVSMMKERIENADDLELMEMISDFSSDPAQTLARYRDEFPEDTKYMTMVRSSSDAMFIEAGNFLASQYETAFGYMVEQQSSNPDLMACHCMDLPLLFGNAAVWSGDKMLQIADMDEMAAASARFQTAVGSFMRSGNPGDDAWKPFESPDDRRVF